MSATMSLRERGAPIAAGVAATAAAGYVAAYDPNTSGWFLRCPFLELTGWQCPGCGLTRATHHLLHGEVFDALQLNVFVPLVLAAIGLAWLAWFVRSTLGRPFAVPQLGNRAATLAIVALALYGVTRNLP